MPDWVDVTPEGYAAPVEHDYLSGYDALRVPLYLTWSGNAGHGAVKRGFDMLAQADLPDHVAVVTTLGGVLREQSNFAGYAALAELASCKESGKTTGVLSVQPYYPATLELLAALAAREGGACMQ